MCERRTIKQPQNHSHFYYYGHFYNYYNFITYLYKYTVATVGINPTFRQVKETDGFVEICVLVIVPTISCPIEFDFNVSLSTCD